MMNTMMMTCTVHDFTKFFEWGVTVGALVAAVGTFYVTRKIYHHKKAQ